MSDVIEVQLEGLVFRLTEQHPTQWSSQRTRNRKGFRAVAVNPENGASVNAGSTWRASDGRWYPGHLGTGRKEGPGYETPEACALEQLCNTTRRSELSANRYAGMLVREMLEANGLRAVQGLEPLTIDGLLEPYITTGAMRLRDALRELTPREREVLKLRCQGFTRREIADRLFIGENTVKNHLTHTYRKVRNAVPYLRGHTMAGTGCVLCYALGGLICDHDHRAAEGIDRPAQDDAGAAAPQASPGGPDGDG